MSGDQAKLVHQLILIANVFLHLVDEGKEKVYAHYPISRAVSQAVRGWLTRRS